jgi:hypothetical protein
MTRPWCLVLIALAGCGGGARTVLESAGKPETVQVSKDVSIRLSGGSVVYQGELTEEGLASLRKLTEGRAIDTLVVNSAGGEIVTGMDFGYWALERGLDVTVDGVCLSSCANYVFTAGRHKTILPGSVVGWHGSAEQAGLLDQMHLEAEKGVRAKKLPPGREAEELVRVRQANVDYLTGAILKQGEFFHRVGVDEYVTRIGNEIYGLPGFYYLSVEDMARFGIRNVSAPEDYARMDLDALRSRTGYRITYLKLRNP